MFWYSHWPHLSTCPPNTAARHTSPARMTRNWFERQFVGGPECRPLLPKDIGQFEAWSGHWLLLGHRRQNRPAGFAFQPVQRADGAADQLGRNRRVARRRVDLVVTEKYLNDAYVGSVLQKVRRETVAQGVGRNFFFAQTAAQPEFAAGLLERQALRCLPLRQEGNR